MVDENGVSATIMGRAPRLLQQVFHLQSDRILRSQRQQPLPVEICGSNTLPAGERVSERHDAHRLRRREDGVFQTAGVDFVRRKAALAFAFARFADFLERRGQAKN